MIRSLIATLLVFCTLEGHGQSDAAGQKHVNVKNKLALEGYDPVSYF
jgi:hypothetical protein